MEGEFTLTGGQVLAAFVFMNATYLSAMGVLFKMLLASKDQERSSMKENNDSLMKVALDASESSHHTARAIELLTAKLKTGVPHVPPQ